tara:strand:+ start:4625 stop:4864 length:240 start_codon:yes stop_codon:yes gene_type:complete
MDSNVLYEVIDENGIRYLDKGFDGGEAVVLPFRGRIAQGDIDMGRFSIGCLENLEKKGRIKSLKSNKKMPKLSNKKDKK